MKQFWGKIKHFKSTENWGDADKVNPYLVMCLDILRDTIGAPIIIKNAYATSGHTSGSMHYEGKAADVMAPSMSLVNFYLAAEKLGLFNGIGIYPFWNGQGLHLDLRSKPARWGRNAAGIYVALDDKFITTCLNNN